MTKIGVATMSSAKRREDFWETVHTLVYAVVLAILIRTFLFEPFNIPSGSMIPTLLVGDYLFVSKYSYGYSKHSFPFSAAPFDGRILESQPERGDVLVFKLPSDQKTDYIKRVIGLPGDTVRMQDGRLFINGDLVERERISEYEYRDRYGSILRPVLYLEKLPGGKEHFILEEGDNRRLDNTPEFKVPAYHYFMMGDNRDNSVDSRANVGYVPADNFVGRAEFLFFSSDGTASLWEIWRWPFATRFSRIFDGIE
jgi:signal peptidase I